MAAHHDDAKMTKAQLQAAWDDLKAHGPGKWLHTNLLIIAGGKNSTGPEGIEYFLSAEKMGQHSTKYKFRLQPHSFEPCISVRVQSFKMIEGPSKHTGSGPFRLEPALALPNHEPDKNAVAVTGQLSGCTIALGGADVIHVRPTGGYAGKATELQDDVTQYGHLVVDAHTETRVTQAFGRHNYPSHATVLGWLGGGAWVFYAQKYNLGSPGEGPYPVVAFAANMPVHDVVH